MMSTRDDEMKREINALAARQLHERLHKAGVELIHRTPSLISSLISAGRSERRVRKVCREMGVPQRPMELIVRELAASALGRKKEDAPI